MEAGGNPRAAQSFKKLIFFYGIPTKREIRGQFYFCPVALFFLSLVSSVSQRSICKKRIFVYQTC